MVSQTVRISDEMAERLERLANATKRSKTSFRLSVLLGSGSVPPRGSHRS